MIDENGVELDYDVTGRLALKYLLYMVAFQAVFWGLVCGLLWITDGF